MEDVRSEEIKTINGRINWSLFFEEYWKKCPVLYKAPLSEPILTNDDILKLLYIQGKKIRKSEPCDITIYDKDRIAIKGAITSKRNRTEIEQFLPTQENDSLSNYLIKLSEIYRFKEYCIFSNGFHIYGHIWRKLKPFFKIIFENVDVSPLGLHTDLFIGNYTKTSFGAHKDNLDNFMFMIFGFKKMLLWHDKLWKDVLKNPSEDNYTLLDYEKYIPYSIQVNLEPGDILYWPSEYWHVGENGNQFSASINIDYLIPSETNSIDTTIENSLRNIIFSDQNIHSKIRYHSKYNNPVHLPDELYRSFTNITSRLNDENLVKLNLTIEWLRKVSAYGSNRSIIENDTKIEIDKDTIIRSNPLYPIHYSVISHKLIVASAGNILVWPNKKELIKLIHVLNEGMIISLNKLYKRIDGDIFIDLEAFIFLVQTLFKIHAIELTDKI